MKNKVFNDTMNKKLQGIHRQYTRSILLKLNESIKYYGISICEEQGRSQKDLETLSKNFKP